MERASECFSSLCCNRSHHIRGSRVGILAAVMIASTLVGNLYSQEIDSTRDSVDFAAMTLTEARIQRFGYGGGISLAQFNGDLQDGANFPGASSPWKIGGFIHFYLRLGSYGDNLVRFNAEAKGEFSTLEASHPTYAFKNRIVGGSLGVEAAFFPASTFRPYVLARFGLLKQSVNVLYSNLPEDIKQIAAKNIDEIIAILPLGFGFEWNYGEHFDLFMRFEKVLTFNDSMDGLIVNVNDNYSVISFGIVVFPGSGKPGQ